MQNDFFYDGATPVPNVDAIVAVLNRLRTKEWTHVFVTLLQRPGDHWWVLRIAGASSFSISISSSPPSPSAARSRATTPGPRSVRRYPAPALGGLPSSGPTRAFKAAGVPLFVAASCRTSLTSSSTMALSQTLRHVSALRKLPRDLTEPAEL